MLSRLRAPSYLSRSCASPGPLGAPTWHNAGGGAGVVEVCAGRNVPMRLHASAQTVVINLQALKVALGWGEGEEQEQRNQL